SGRARIGPLRLGGGLELEWGDLTAFAARTAVSVAVTPTVRATLGWRGSSATAEQQSYGDHALSLALAGSRAGLTGAFRAADATAGALAARARSVEVRAWADLGLDVGVTLRATETVERTEATWDRVYLIGGYEFISRRSFSRLEAVRYQDLELDVTVPLGPVAVTGFAGRGFAPVDGQDRHWAFARAVAPFLNRLELVAEAGRDGGLPAIAQGPRDFARLGLRMHLTGPDAAAPAPPAPAGDPDGAHLGARARVDGGERPTLRITAPGARSVEVRGDFTGWEPRAMEATGSGRWMFPVPAGVHRFDLRLDGGDWGVPAGVPVVRDEFTGAPVAVVVVDG
ncbi:MAG: hypothetical protein GWM90_08825, partial [Gemmatimonadetes bacterium]|nr:hypothetical protein [Gemmatimonadota bacterium]NIQ53998.1 hypothetical protein [Gemmatimonadota bacterium]NIU74182.1 hypothetical protein [Gammaproteobacteria bacterium]NIX44213.1 hypothetical protein [Gemmatimonadota bacterium]NIY08444.1 hypothetical protein [Gemmatimonadota bacterium]